jgi:hypothetical protein
LVEKADWYVWSNAGLHLTDVRIEVDVTRLDGPEENEFGLICRYRDDRNFYLFTAGSDGYYSLSKFVQGEFEFLGEQEYVYHEAIRRENGTNHMRLDCVGDTLKAFINGQEVGWFQDDDLNSGDVGLAAGTFTESGADLLFDNFTVIRPE